MFCYATPGEDVMLRTADKNQKYANQASIPVPQIGDVVEVTGGDHHCIARYFRHAPRPLKVVAVQWDQEDALQVKVGSYGEWLHVSHFELLEPAVPSPAESPASGGGEVVTQPGKYRTVRFDETGEDRHLANVEVFANGRWYGSVAKPDLAYAWTPDGVCVACEGVRITGPYVTPPEPANNEAEAFNKLWEHKQAVLSKIQAIRNVDYSRGESAVPLVVAALEAVVDHVAHTFDHITQSAAE